MITNALNRSAGAATPTFVFLIGVLFLLSHGSALSATAGPTSAKGALTDNPAWQFEIGDTTVHVFEWFRNPVLEQKGWQHWKEKAYFYATPFEILKRENGSPRIIGPTPLSDRLSTVGFFLSMKQVNRDALHKFVKEKNSYAQKDLIKPIVLFQIEFSEDEAGVIRFRLEDGQIMSRPLAIKFVLPTPTATRFVNRLKSGDAAFHLTYRTLVKHSKMQFISIKGNDVAESSAYQHYSGPAGPDFVTAAQAVDIARTILNEMNVYVWNEGDPGTYVKVFAAMIDRVINKRRDLIHLDDDKKLRRWLVSIDTFINMRSVIRKLAADSKNLNDDQWCRKYKNQLRELSERTSNSSRSSSFGLNIPIPQFPIGLSFSGDYSGSGFEKKEYEWALDRSDCGRKTVEKQFKFSVEGEIYVPKSIYVHQNISKRTQINTDETITHYAFEQSYATHDQYIFSGE